MAKIGLWDQGPTLSTTIGCDMASGVSTGVASLSVIKEVISNHINRYPCARDTVHAVVMHRNTFDRLKDKIPVGQPLPYDHFYTFSGIPVYVWTTEEEFKNVKAELIARFANVAGRVLVVEE